MRRSANKQTKQTDVSLKQKYMTHIEGRVNVLPASFEEISLVAVIIILPQLSYTSCTLLMSTAIVPLADDPYHKLRLPVLKATIG